MQAGGLGCRGGCREVGGGISVLFLRGAKTSHSERQSFVAAGGGGGLSA